MNRRPGRRLFGLVVCFVALATVNFGCKHDEPVAAPTSAPSTSAQLGASASTAGGIVGKWVIDMNLSGKIPPEVAADAKKMAEGSYILFDKGGSYKQSMMGMEMSGTYTLKSGKVRLLSTDSMKKGSTDSADFDRKKGTLTFSPGPKRVVYVRARS